MQTSDYPAHLIPDTRWKRRMDSDEILESCGEFCVLRRIDGEVSTCINSDNGIEFLTHDALRDSQAANLSMSLAGALLEVQDMRYIQKGEAQGDWDGQCVDAVNLICDNVTERPQPWFVVAWKASTIHKKEIPYKKGVNTQKDFERLKADSVRQVLIDTLEEYNSALTPLRGVTSLNHRPTNLNYWHFTLDIYPFDSKAPIMEVSSKNKSFAKQVCKQLLRYSFMRIDRKYKFPKLRDSLWMKA